MALDVRLVVCDDVTVLVWELVREVVGDVVAVVVCELVTVVVWLVVCELVTEVVGLDVGWRRHTRAA